MEYKQLIRENTKTSIVATMTLANGTVLNLTGDDFQASQTTFDDSSSSSSDFEIGACVVNTFSTVLNNFDGKFNSYDFTGAVIKPTVTKELSASTELIPKTYYTIDQPKTISTTISLTGNDNMNKFSKDYSNVTTSYPATLLTIANNICNYCGVILDTQTFSNYGFVINTKPDTSSLTCLDMLSFVCQIAGCFGRINVNGHLEIKWYDLVTAVNTIDAKTFTPYELNQTIDGGNFTDTSSQVYDGGGFSDLANVYTCYAFKNFSISTDDVVITGIRVTTSDNKNKVLQGSEGYVIEISNNKLIDSTNYQSIASFVGNKIIGMTFRPFNVSSLSDATIEAGDTILLEKEGNNYYSYITRAQYKFGGYETFQNTAKSPLSNSSKSYSASTKTYQKSKEETARQLTSYDLQMQNLTQLQANAFGLFTSEEKFADGSVIYYYHNKPTRSASNIIWKFSGGAFTVSTDGGVTWNTGIDAQGNAVVNVLSAVGINAFWIDVGDLVVGGTNNNTNGSIVVKDISGNEIGRWNKNGISITKGSFNINNKFIVDTSGNLTASNVNLSGTINASSGSFSGNITSSSITSSSININNKFIVDSSGNMTATNASVSGSISAISGTIGGFGIGNNTITFASGNSGAGLLGTIDNANIAFYAGANTSNIANAPYKVLHDGTMYASNVNLSGTISGGTINGSTINGGNIHITNVTDPADQTRMYITSTSYGTYFSPGGVRAEGSGWYSYMGYNEMGVKNTSDTFHSIFNSSGMITSGNVLIGGTLTAYGAKSRAVKTSDFGNVLLHAYETPTPYFGDIGEGVTDDEGVCIVMLEEIFGQTIDRDTKYQVFLQKYGEGELYVSERNYNYFIVKGTKNLSFAWELKAVQRDFDSMRLEQHEKNEKENIDDNFLNDICLYNEEILSSNEQIIENYMDELLKEYSEEKNE